MVLTVFVGAGASCSSGGSASQPATTRPATTTTARSTTSNATKAAAPDSATLATKLLAPGDLGEGWTAGTPRLGAEATLDANALFCEGTALAVPGKVGRYVGAAEVDFTHGTDALGLSQQLYSAESKSLSTLLSSFRGAIATCDDAKLADRSGGADATAEMVSVIVKPLTLPTIGLDQVAYSITSVVSGHTATIAIVMARKGNVGLTVTEVTVGTPDLNGLADAARFALTKV